MTFCPSAFWAQITVRSRHLRGMDLPAVARRASLGRHRIPCHRPRPRGPAYAAAGPVVHEEPGTASPSPRQRANASQHPRVTDFSEENFPTPLARPAGLTTVPVAGAVRGCPTGRAGGSVGTATRRSVSILAQCPSPACWRHRAPVPRGRYRQKGSMMSPRQPVTATRGKAAALTRLVRGRVLLGVPIALGLVASLAAGGMPPGSSRPRPPPAPLSSHQPAKPARPARRSGHGPASRHHRCPPRRCWPGPGGRCRPRRSPGRLPRP
jgi:hypothetical protein